LVLSLLLAVALVPEPVANNALTVARPDKNPPPDKE